MLSMAIFNPFTSELVLEEVVQVMMLNICSVDSWDFKDEWESNANLISSAPEMYKMLDDLANGRGTDYPIEQLLSKAKSTISTKLNSSWAPKLNTLVVPV